MIKEKILKLKQDINSVGHSAIIRYLKDDFIEKMELDSPENSYFLNIIREMNNLADDCLKDIAAYGRQIDLKGKYSEGYIYSKLNSLLHIQKIPESSSKTPDFKAIFRGCEIFVELKALNMLEGTLKHKRIMEDTMEAKISMEKQIEQGKRIASSVTEEQPYFVEGKYYDYSSSKLVIESLIDKISQNIKTDQYSLGDTILLVDFSDQLLLLYPPEKSIMRTHVDSHFNNEVSGELWHIALGEIDMPLYKPIEFEGLDNSDGNLSKQGILHEYPFIKGVIFHVKEKFYSIAKLKEDNLHIIDFLKYISEKSHIELPAQNGS